MSLDGSYDWWAAERRPERLRPLQLAIERAMEDPALPARGVVIFGAAVELEREVIVAQVAAADGEQAAAVLTEHCGYPVEVEVTASAEYLEQDIAWTSWRGAPQDTRVHIWADDTDTEHPDVTVDETEHAVVVTLRERRYQGARASGYSVELPVDLRRPLGTREVIDGATGRPRRFGMPR